MVTIEAGFVKNRIIIIALLILLPVSLCSKKKYPQEDRQAWFGAEIDCEIAKDFELSISEELRYYKNRSVLAQSLTNFGASYKATGWFRPGLFIRYRIMPDEEEQRWELYTNFTFKFDLWGIDFSDRVRLHFKFREDRESINNLRNKLTAGYYVWDWLEPYAAAELFYRFFYEGGDRLAQGRYYTGAKIKLDKNNEIDLFFMREQEYNTDKAIHSNVIGVEYSLQL